MLCTWNYLRLGSQHVVRSNQLNKLEDLKFKLKLNVEPVLTTYSAFDTAFEKYYGGVAFVGEAIESFQKMLK